MAHSQNRRVVRCHLIGRRAAPAVFDSRPADCGGETPPTLVKGSWQGGTRHVTCGFGCSARATIPHPKEPSGTPGITKPSLAPQSDGRYTGRRMEERVSPPFRLSRNCGECRRTGLPWVHTRCLPDALARLRCACTKRSFSFSRFSAYCRRTWGGRQTYCPFTHKGRCVHPSFCGSICR